MKLIATRGRASLVEVYLLRLQPEPWALVECVGALDPAVSAAEKRVIVVSTQFGCALGCTMCDAGTQFFGNLSAAQIHQQIEFVLGQWAAEDPHRCPKLKVQMARMGEPALNPAVLAVLRQLPARLGAPGLLPCIATVAPVRASDWLGELVRLRRELYAPDKFQLQLSVQSTSSTHRRRMIPASVWTPAELGAYARAFVEPGDRRVVLNFALAEGVPVEAAEVARAFSPEHCVVKLTPLNPTAAALRSGWRSVLSAAAPERAAELCAALARFGFDCIVSIGEQEESDLGSSCGQLALLARGPSARALA